jgi:lipoprotein NlpI
MRAAVALVAAALWCGSAFATNETPLFDYARELPFVSLVGDRHPLDRALYDIEHNPPPREGCSRTLGANRFASMYETLGGVQANLGDNAGAIESLTKSLACRPRVARVHARLAEQLMHLGRLDDARAEIARARAIDVEDEDTASVLMRIEFIQEHWPEAIAELRGLLARTIDSERATYWECFLWLAQRRSGVSNPEDSPAELTDDWPRPVLEFLRGALTEEDVLDVVQDEGGDRRQREMLSEALFYVGQARLANGDVENARLYFTSTVNLKVMFFIEHHLALAELTKMRAGNP